MTNYQGCKCPVCQKLFTEHDDIVICPECGAPYHRKCWKEHGECVFADRHGPDFEFQHPDKGPRPLEPTNSTPITDNTELSCSACGAKNPNTNIFCESCGAPLHGMSTTPPQPTSLKNPTIPPNNPEQAELFAMAGISPEQEIDGIKVRDWSTYLGRSAPYYMMFYCMEQTKRKIFPSFCGFFFGPLFLLYRKVWSWGILSAAASLLCSIPQLLMLILASNNPSAQPAEFLITAQQICSILNIGLQFVLMLFSFYLIRIDGAKKIHQMKKQSQAPDDFHKMLAAKAAPSWIGIILMIVALFLLSFTLMPLFGPYLPDVLLGPLSLF